MTPESTADFPIAGPQPVGPMTPIMHRVVSRVQEMVDTVTFELEPLDTAISVPTPGQFNMLWAFGMGEAPISIAAIGPPKTERVGAQQPTNLTHTIRSVGIVTTALCEIDVGGLIGVRGPFGTGWDLEAAEGRDILIIAGGLGSAPIRPIVQFVLANRDAFGRLAVLIGARSPDLLLYRSELERWRDRADVHLEMTVDTALPSWRGDVGLVTRLIDRCPVDLATASVFICGPEVMMRHAAQSTVERGARPTRVSVSLERNMHCAIGHCGHCQLGPAFICKDGPVLDWGTVEPLLAVRAR
jgi:anaerobic sulfite reductase subunit B